MAFVYDSWARAGFTETDAKIVLRGVGIDNTGKVLSEWEPALRELRLSAFPLTREHVAMYLDLIDKHQVQYLYGYPSAIEVMGRHMHRLGRKPKLPILGVLPISEPLYDHQRRTIAAAFGPQAKIAHFYGLSEKAVFGAELPDEPGVYASNPLYGIAELVTDCGTPVTEPGREGRLVGTGFISTGMPFIRYDTGDSARLIELPETRSVTFHTRLIDEQIDRILDKKMTDSRTLALGAYFWMMRQRLPAASVPSHNPWQSRETTGWQMSAGGDGLSSIPVLHLETNGASAEIRFAPRQADGSMTIRVNDDKLPINLVRADGDDGFTAIVEGRSETVRIRQNDQTLFVHDRRGVHTLTAIPYLTYISAAAEMSGELRAPMMGMIRKVNVAVGDRVRAGDVAAILESMKMELRISSQIDGVVSAVNCRAGDMVERNAVVAVVDADGQA